MEGAPVGVGVVVGMTDEAFAAWVTASCERQGVPVKVTDVRVVAEVAALLSGGTARPPAKRGRVARRSEPPHQVDPGGVKLSGSAHTRVDDRMVE